MTNHFKSAQIGVIGLGVMGKMLALNLERNNYQVAGYDLDSEKVNGFGIEAKSHNLAAFWTLDSFVASLETPRRILMMVPAGNPVDSVIDSLSGKLTRGDLLMDGGNSYFTDTERRAKLLAKDGVHYLGVGISGGEQGALWGPALMPGGSFDGWRMVQPILEDIAAKYDSIPCVAYIGAGGAGNYVKMIHNGIEYADMQLIAEIYDLLHRGLGISNSELADIFSGWNTGKLKSYLIEITSTVLRRKEGSKDMVDLILDQAEQKGTGKWASQNAYDVGMPIPTINAAVESRIISSLKSERIAAAKSLPVKLPDLKLDKQQVLASAREALFASKIISYAQGFGILKQASTEYQFNLNLAEIAHLWRAGCIIRADILNDIRAAFIRKPDLENLLLDETLGKAVLTKQSDLRDTLYMAIGLGIPMLAVSSALAYFDAYRSASLPANLTQAQRDHFGAHTFRRVDREGVFHIQWDG